MPNLNENDGNQTGQASPAIPQVLGDKVLTLGRAESTEKHWQEVKEKIANHVRKNKEASQQTTDGSEV